jgi:hypothetical protein
MADTSRGTGPESVAAAPLTYLVHWIRAAMQRTAPWGPTTGPTTTEGLGFVTVTSEKIEGAAAGDAPLSRRQRRRNRPMTRRRMIWRWVRRSVAIVIVAFLAWSAITFYPYYRDAHGEPMNVVAAEWGRDHGLGPIVAVAENFYYAHFDVTAVGGTPSESTKINNSAPGDPGIGTQPGSNGTSPATHVRAHLNPPSSVTSPVKNSLALEGVWQPVGSKVDGISAIYATRVRPDAIHTSVLASMMWIDTKLATAMFIPGYIEPGGPSPSNGSLPQQYFPDVLANFNGAFRLEDTQAGYYYAGQTVAPLVAGKAAAVVYKDGSIKIGDWGRDVSLTSDVQVVRQNLNLIVDHGKSQVTSSYSWGATTHGENLAWRSAIGERADGSIVYVGSPGLSASALADTMVRAGVVRAMVLDMNNWWVAGFYFTHAADGTPVCHKLDPNIQEGCNRFLQSYKRDSFQFIAKP